MSAVLMTLAFPPFDLWWCAPLIPVPLMILAMTPGPSARRAAIWGALGALPCWLWAHLWIFGVSAFGAPILLLYHSLFVALFVWAGARLVKPLPCAVLTLGVVWVAVEFLRSDVLFTGYPWYLAAHPLIGSPGSVLASPARWGGFELVSVLNATVAASVALLVVRRFRPRDFVKLAGCVAVMVGLSFAASKQPIELGDTIVVGVVQPDIPQDNRMAWTERQRWSDLEDLARLTIASATDDERVPDVIVWPEGLAPGWTFDPISLERERAFGNLWDMRPDHPDDAPDLFGIPQAVPATLLVDQLLELQYGLGIPMIVGGPGYDNLQIRRTGKGTLNYDSDGFYNSVFVVRDGVVKEDWYKKMHLTPFGEVMPVISRFDALEELLLGLGANGMQFNLEAGDDPSPLVVDLGEGLGQVSFATPVCFEATVPKVCRDLVFGPDGDRQAQIMLNLTNDGWFGSWDPGRESHLLGARWRCVELATPMVRSANTGVSCLIDARGRLVDDPIQRVERIGGAAGYLNVRVELAQGTKTLGSKVMGWIGWGCVLLVMIGLVASFRTRTANRADGNALEQEPDHENMAGLETQA